jgi:sugar O-acyltransferase (sialic acid O-acetyltransferase NeuD family)
MNNLTIKKIAIFGAGGFGREVAFLIEEINKKEYLWEIIGFFDDAKKSGIVNDYKVLGRIEELNKIKEELYLVIAIGDPIAKKTIVQKIKNSLIKFPILIHPSVIISNKVEIGEGSILCAGNILTTNIRIGKHVIINLNCTIGHDAIINDYCSLMPSVNISGETEIGECSFLGTGSLIINQRKVGKNVIIGAGSSVIKDIPDDCTAIGSPAKPIKFRKK